MSKLTNKEVIEYYRMYMDGKAENTIEGYVKHINELFEFLDGKSAYSIDYFDVQRFLKGLKDKGNTQVTVNKKISGLNSFFRYCKASQIQKEELHFGIKKDKQKKKRDDSKIRISSEMFDTLICENELFFDMKNKLSSRDVKDKILLYMFLYGGLRRSEIINLKVEDVKKVEMNEQVLLEVNIVESKRDKSRTIYLPEKVYYAMSDWLIERKKLQYKSEYVFCTESDKKLDKGESYLPRKAKQFSKVANIKVDGETAIFTPHDFRHGTLSMLAKKGIAPIEIAKFAGNTLEVVMKVYIHKDESASCDVATCLV